MIHCSIVLKESVIVDCFAFTFLCFFSLIAMVWRRRDDEFVSRKDWIYFKGRRENRFEDFRRRQRRHYHSPMGTSLIKIRSKTRTWIKTTSDVLEFVDDGAIIVPSSPRLISLQLLSRLWLRNEHELCAERDFSSTGFECIAWWLVWRLNEPRLELKKTRSSDKYLMRFMCRHLSVQTMKIEQRLDCDPAASSRQSSSQCFELPVETLKVIRLRTPPPIDFP